MVQVESWTNGVFTIIIPADLIDENYHERIIEVAGENAVVTYREEPSEEDVSPS